MKHLRFTKTGIAALPLPTSGNYRLYPDSEQKSLYIRVTAGGSRSFVADKNLSRGRVHVTLGKAGTESLTTTQARAQTRFVLSLIDQGLTAAQIRERLARAEDRIPADAVTFGQVLEQYLVERQHKLAENTRRDYRALAGTHLAAWRNLPLETINEAAIVAKFVSISSPSRANYAFRLVRLIFNYAKSIRDEEGKPIVTGNPVDVLSQRRIWHTDRMRRDVIQLSEIKSWWTAVQGLAEGESERTGDGRFAVGGIAANSNAAAVRDYLIFLVATGLRRNEAATLRWEDVDFRGRMFTVSIETKNHTPHSMPLSDFLFAMLQRRYDDPDRGLFVFGRNGPLKNPLRQMQKVAAVSGVSFTPHSLRRTFATVAEQLDIPFIALQRLLNHRAASITARYTILNIERLRGPMEKISDFILRAAGERQTAGVAEIKRNRVT